jgi:hypothetical protein
MIVGVAARRHDRERIRLILQHLRPIKKRESGVDGDPVQGLVGKKVEIHRRAMSETQRDGGSTVKDKAELESGTQFGPEPPSRFR